MIVLIDNYDSFTYNVVQAIARLTSEEIRVLRSKEYSLQDIIDLNPSRLIVSPGPGRPENAGVSMEAIRYFASKIPILGICLGHQSIAQAFGASIVQAKFIKHGIAEEIALDAKGLFRTIGAKSVFTRYHSLVVDEASLPADFEITARAEDGDIMGIRHQSLPIEGVQFHPESIAAPDSEAFFKAFLNYRLDALPVKEILNDLTSGKSLDQKTAELFMEDLTEGVLDERQMSAILTAITAKGPAASEIAGCASVLYRKKTPLPIKNKELTDIVGTGGDSKGSFNISSMSALVAAACGLPIAKHGNRAVSSQSGSADFYEKLGIKIDISPETAVRMIQETNFAFLFAPVYHSAMRFAAPVRNVMGIKTIMNLIGPLSNPAGAVYQMLGVYSKDLLHPVAEASKMLGSKRVMVVVSEDGFDEISPYAPSHIVEIDEWNQKKEYQIHPRDFGVPDCHPDDLDGGSSKENALLAMDLLHGKGKAGILYSCALNAGAALYISQKANTLLEAYQMALKALQDGSVVKKLEEIKAFV